MMIEQLLIPDHENLSEGLNNVFRIVLLEQLHHPAL